MAYGDPALRERLKKKIMKESRGGPPGKWSARKAQLLATEYKAKFKGRKTSAYKGKKSDKAKSLDKWSSQNWQTSNGQKKTTKEHPKYLPKKQWDRMTTVEKKKADSVKRKKDAKTK